MVWTGEETRLNTSEERLWRWYHLGEEIEEDRSRDGWTVSTERDMRTTGTTKDEVHDRTGWRRIVSAAVTEKNAKLQDNQPY